MPATGRCRADPGRDGEGALRVRLARASETKELEET